MKTPSRIFVRGCLILAGMLGAAACGDDSDSGTGEETGGDGKVACEGSVCTVSGTFTEDLSMTADKTWLLSGGVFIGNDADETVLSIEAGTQILGQGGSPPSMLVITRGSKIMAEGTRSEPIVFSSANEVGRRARGDWGGVIINGRAPTNVCSDANDADCSAVGEGGTGSYGGNVAGDNSGILRYVRVEFAGALLSPENELNGIAFQGVGSGTTVDFIQVHMNKDDGVEFFGGTVGIKHVLLTGINDDSMDWTDGWNGQGQFIVIQQYDDGGDNGIEGDNNGEVNNAEPRSNPTLSHLTLIGSPDSINSDIGVLLREGTAAHITNTLIANFNEACLDIDDAATFAQANDDAIQMAQVFLQCGTAFETETGDQAEDFDLPAFFGNQTGSATTSDVLVPGGLNIESPDFTPYAAAASGSVVPEGSFFDDVAFIGAVDPSSDWTTGWTTAARN